MYHVYDVQEAAAIMQHPRDLIQSSTPTPAINPAFVKLIVFRFCLTVSMRKPRSGGTDCRALIISIALD